ncbi:FAD-binding protein [Embleya hyalina]|uniref:6-hydroxy-D-nicotine oxidase n=1 Tax=Embleya hyalina TaxID=516124 RepID=A0A401YQY4_9ACTN|nr:FAD-binding protein [Embleya hyalina]GCD97006.1 6-hydroxy-D-nicotine oxidase [Embleya hyalina]
MSDRSLPDISRRTFARGLAATATVVGIDTLSGRWITRAAAAEAGSSAFDAVPRLDGELLLDEPSRQAVAVDNGNLTRVVPRAVLHPGSTADIQTMIRFARRNGIKVAARGAGHTTDGQSLSPGLVIATGSLNRIHSIGPAGADVDAGVLWSDLVRATLAQGLVPPQLTDYTNLSVAGTLSVGGVSGRFAQGAQIDRVRRLEVVTGTGESLICSATENRELFEVMLGGLGQCGVITRARVDLVRAPTAARIHTLRYTDNARFFRDLRTLLRRGELDEVYNIWAPGPTGWDYLLQAVSYYDAPSSPNSARLLRDLSVSPTEASVVDLPFAAYLERINNVIDATSGYERLVKPWFDVWLPDSTIEGFVGAVLPTLTPEDVGPSGFLLLFPQQRAKLTRPFFNVPDSNTWVFLFDILTSSPTDTPPAGFASAMKARNRTLFDRARAAGGTRYPIGTLDFDRADWKRQFGARWPELVRRRQRYDPDGILAPGVGIF